MCPNIAIVFALIFPRYEKRRCHSTKKVSSKVKLRSTLKFYMCKNWRLQGLAIVRPIIFERPNARSFSFSSYTHKNLVLTVLLWDTVPLCVMWSDLSLNSVLSHHPILQIWTPFVVGCPSCFWSEFFISTSSQMIVSAKNSYGPRNWFF